MGLLRGGKSEKGADGVGENENAGLISAATEQAFLEYLMSQNGGLPASDDLPARYAPAIPTPSLEQFQQGARQYAASVMAHESDRRATEYANGHVRRNSAGNFWNMFGLPNQANQTNLTSFEPMNASIQFAPLTLLWLTLMYSYTTYGIIQRAIDVPVFDAFRGGLDIESDEMEPGDIDDLNDALEEQGILEAFRDANIWARLFGGGALIFNQEGEDYSRPLDMDRLGNAPIEIYDASRWELGAESRIPVSGFYDFYGLKVHASRVMTICGKRAPFLIRDQLAGWGLSEIQRMSEDFNSYMRTKNAKFELMLEAKVDIFKIEGYKNQLASPMASELTKRRIGLVNRFKSFNNAMLLDKNDDYEQKQVGFTGIAEMAKENRMDIAEGIDMPQSKIWGMGSTGLSSGEDDLENYNAKVESQIREPNRPRLRRVIKMAIRAVHGAALSFRFKYKPLRVLTSNQEEEIKKSKTDRVILNLQNGLIDAREAVEWQQKEGLIPIKIKSAAKFSELGGTPIQPEAEAEQELRPAAPGDDPAAAREHPRGPGEGEVRSYEREGREPPPIGMRGGGGPGSEAAAEAAGISGAGDPSSAIPWPGPQRQLKGANLVKEPKA